MKMFIAAVSPGDMSHTRSLHHLVDSKESTVYIRAQDRREQMVRQWALNVWYLPGPKLVIEKWQANIHFNASNACGFQA